MAGYVRGKVTTDAEHKEQCLIDILLLAED